MNKHLATNTKNALCCPYCYGELRDIDTTAVCSSCGCQYTYSPSGSLDLRLNRPKKYSYELTLGSSLEDSQQLCASLLSPNPNPQVDYQDIEVPNHLTSALLSHFPKAQNDNALMLDIGCGTAVHKAVAEHAGFEYIGIDYHNQNAPIIGDAHAIPLKDDSVDFVLSIAVLEHIRFPFVMMEEIHRVLKTDGMFIGTVAFLEPFHEDSFYHHTHLGTFNVLQAGGFTVEILSASDEWNSLVAQFHMGLFPKMPIPLARMLAAPIRLLHKLWWKLGKLRFEEATELMRITKNTGAFTFIAYKRA